jgi:hypothetical protein
MSDCAEEDEIEVWRLAFCFDSSLLDARQWVRVRPEPRLIGPRATFCRFIGDRESNGRLHWLLT